MISVFKLFLQNTTAVTLIVEKKYKINQKDFESERDLLLLVLCKSTLKYPQKNFRYQAQKNCLLLLLINQSSIMGIAILYKFQDMNKGLCKKLHFARSWSRLRMVM